MIIDPRVVHVSALAFQHPKGLEHVPSGHFFQNADVHQAVVHRSARGEGKLRAACLAVLNQKQRKIIGDETVVQAQGRRSSTCGKNGQHDTDVVSDRPHPAHFFSLNGRINPQAPRDQVVRIPHHRLPC